MEAALNRKPDQAPDALSVLNSVFGLPAFRGEQEEIVRHVTDGGNCLVLMPTGGGKSLCYQLPSLLREGCGIVVSPLIALMRDQVAGLLEAGVKAAVLNSTLSFEEANRRRAAAAGRRSRRALCRAGAAVDAALPRPCSPGPRSRCLRSTRRIACRNGGTISARNISGCRCIAGAFSRRAADRADRHRRRADAQGDRRAAQAYRCAALCRELRPPEHPLRDRRQAERARPAQGLHQRAPCRRCRHRLLPVARQGRGYRRRVEQGRHAGAALSRRPRRRPALPQPGPLHQRGRRRDRRHHRVRHGHRQARRALRRASRSAEEHRGLLPGDRPRRARRQALQRLDGLWPVRHRAAAPHDRRIHRLGCVQARVDRQARCAGRPRGDRGLPAQPPARLFRRSGRAPAIAAIATIACRRRSFATAR